MIPRADVPSEIFFLLLILGISILIWDILERKRRKIRAQWGLTGKSQLKALRRAGNKQTKEYYSKTLNLSGQPEALIVEGGQISPVAAFPTSQKVKNRHILEIVALMYLIEECEGVRPTSGTLLMGKDQRVVKIEYTNERKRWLEAIIAEMKSILEGIPAVPAPNFYKCKGCGVRSKCNHSAFNSR